MAAELLHRGGVDDAVAHEQRHSRSPGLRYTGASRAVQFAMDTGVIPVSLFWIRTLARSA